MFSKISSLLPVSAFQWYSMPDRTTSQKDATSRAELDQSIRSGGRAVAASHLVGQIVSLAVLSVLLRLLGPDPFGLLAMVLPLLLLARTFTAFGLNVAAVQRESLGREEASSVLWFTLAIGLLTTAALWAAADAVAWFYDQPKLAPAATALAGTSLAFALGVLQQARLERHLKLTALAVTRLAAQLLSGLLAIAYAISMGAENHYGGVTTLVVQQYAELLLLAAVVWALEPWLPQAPWRGAAISDMLRFGRQYTASGLFFTLGQQLDKILIGSLLGERALGLYSQAFNIAMKPVTVVSTATTGVMLPALSRARPDAIAYQELVLAFNRLVAIFLFPVGVGLMIVGPEVMSFLGGGQWQAAGPLLAILAAIVLVQGFINIAGSAFASMGKTRQLMLGAAALAGGSLLGLLLGWWIGSLAGDRLIAVTTGYAAALVLVLFLPYQAYCLWSVGVRVAAWRGAVKRAAVAALGMGIIVLGVKLVLLGLTSLGDPARLAVLVPLGVVCYLGMARQEIRWVIRRWIRNVSTPEGRETTR